jgi:Spy/CpxP family protein refolding chaperone
MAKRTLLVVVTACLALGAARAAAQVDPPRRGKWWQDQHTQREFDLTQSQVDAIERIFQDKLQDRIRLRQELVALEARWQDALTRGEIDDDEAEKLIDKVEEARMRRNTARTLVLFQIYRVLTPEQRVKLRESQRLSRPR